MATEGVKIDVNLKYKDGTGKKVIRIRESQNTYYPLIVIFSDEFEDLYTEDGFFYSDKRDSEYNLILDEEHTKNKRKVIQLSTCIDGINNIFSIIALCDDGEMFMSYSDNNEDKPWKKIEPIPQD